jgi:hypothetical protein
MGMPRKLSPALVDDPSAWSIRDPAKTSAVKVWDFEMAVSRLLLRLDAGAADAASDHRLSRSAPVGYRQLTGKPLI